MLEKISKDFVIDHRTRHVEGLPPLSHSHQFNEIYFLQSGKCHVYIENEKYTLEDGSVLFIPAFKEHTFVYYDTVDVKRTVLYISTDSSIGILTIILRRNRQSFHKPPYKVVRKSFSNLSSLFEKIQFEKYNIDNLSAPLTKAYFFEMIIYIIRCHRYNDEIIKKTDLSNITTGEILHYIDDNYGNDLTLPGLAKKFGLSESGLSKKIKAFTNMTFKEYLTKTRIEAAKSLLISSEKSITEIAVLCGYNSSNFFGDVFKKNMGMSPSSYKKMLTMN